MSVVVIGIDPSLSGTGVVVLGGEGKGVILDKAEVGYSLIRGSSWIDRTERVKKIAGVVSNFVSSAGADEGVEVVVVFEGYSLGSRGGQTFFIGELYHALHEIFVKAFHIGCVARLVEVAPTILKKFVTGKGNASKANVAGHVARKWDVVLSTDNLTDAYVLAQIGRVVSGVLRVSAATAASLKKVVIHERGKN